jgi:hydrogenase maturation protein HypF
MKLIFKGIVQGVGFRPTIYRIAKDLGLNGYVLNKGSEVEVVIDKDKDEFIKQVKKHLPTIAKITHIAVEKNDRNFSDFRILHSKKGERESLIPADTAICKECLKELFDESDRRYLFPFTNCTVCGARYSVVKDVPYDRERTSMDEFKLCSDCQLEYTSPLNRRYHAQTISCPKCGPVYKLYDKNKKDLGEKQAVNHFANQIDAGKIGVIKSWGGMHLCCNLDQINRFREWYKRPQKAFALMVKDIKTAEKYGELTEEERKILLSKASPIVLVNKISLEEASPGLNTIGLFLPYTGLHYLLFSHLKSDALVMTSSNVPGEAMFTTNEEAFSIDADIYLLHNREIPNRVDDSVVRMWKNNTFFIRKSRGYVPEPIAINYDKKILSVGAGENITGAISHDKNIFITQYIGNSKYYSTLEFLEESLRHFMKLTMKKQELDAVVQDLHPGYDSRMIAKKFSEEFSAPLYDIQHHFAHAVSLMVDQNIDECVTIAIDGLGYGSDGTFWGSEILETYFDDFNRIGHLEYIPLLGGDMATKDPRRLVFAIFKNFDKEKFFTGNDAEILSKIINKSPKSCSLGRILDALSCYLNICCKRTYDGEPAMKLEKYLAVGKDNYSFDIETHNEVIETIDLFRQIEEKINGPLTEKEKADFVYSFVKTIIDEMTLNSIFHAEQKGIKNIGFTGGVSYNIPITEMIASQVNKSDLNLIVHNRIPNGDGGISVGQNAIIGHKLHN